MSQQRSALPPSLIATRQLPRRRRALALAVHLAAAGLLATPLLSLPAMAQTTQQQARQYAIPAGPVSTVLNRFAAEAGVFISGAGELGEGRQSPGLQGQFSVGEGLERLLNGTSLRAVRQGDGSYRLEELPADVELSTMRVEAEWIQETAYGPVQGIAATRSATGTKTDTPIIETPQSISVVSSEEFQNYGARNVNQALGYTAGLSNAYGGGSADTIQDSMTSRGFGLFNSYRDGSKYQVNVFDGQQELYGLERLEVLKGPSSILYGVATPGGLINTVSKRPTSEPLREVNIQTGSFDRRQISADFSDALDEEGEFSYRLTMLRRESNTFIDHVPDDRTYIAPAFKWQPNEDTSLTLLSEYQHDESIYFWGLPSTGTILSNPNGDIPQERFGGEPGFDEYDNERYSIGYLFEHDFSDHLRLNHSLRTFRTDRDIDNTGLSQTPQSSDGRLYGRFAHDRRDASRALTSDTSLQYDWEAGVTSNTTLVGLDYTRQRHESERYRRTVSPLDLYDPVYGRELGEPTPNAYSKVERKEQMGLYFQNQMKIDYKWVVMLGGRQDWTDTKSSQYFDPSQEEQQDDDAFTGRVGFVYLADNGLAPFASFSQSFEVATGTDRSGNQFEPTQGEQYELGIRFQPEGWDTLLTATTYELTQENVLVTDPVDTSFQRQMGEVRSRGVELEAKTEIGPNANLVAAYAYTDARTTKSSPATPDKVGERTGQTPYNQFSLWGDYRLGNFGLSGLKLGAGVRYVGSTLPNSFLDGEVSDFTLVDAMISYETGSWLLSLNATNLTDETYIESCTYACFYGEPRSIIGTASYQW